MPKHISYIIAYVIVAGLTFGYVYNKNWYANDCGQPRDRWVSACDGGMHGLLSVYAGAAWPLYWVGYIGLTVTDMGR